MANATTKHAKKVKDPNARDLIGRKVYYIGQLTCPSCGHQQRKGMASEFKGEYFCSESCVLKVANG